MPRILPRKFYDRDSVTVAQELLGKIIVRAIDGEVLSGKIVETEAYLSSGDEAAHNFKGKTKRNQSLYKEGGHAYVHVMRQYFLLDVVTEGEDVPGSVLIRAVEPLEGIGFMKEKRGIEKNEEVANGPSKFCIAFGITKELDGTDMTEADSPLYILDSEELILKERIKSSGRIGISKAKDAPLRFWIAGNPHVSRKD